MLIFLEIPLCLNASSFDSYLGEIAIGSNSLCIDCVQSVRILCSVLSLCFICSEKSFRKILRCFTFITFLHRITSMWPKMCSISETIIIRLEIATEFHISTNSLTHRFPIEFFDGITIIHSKWPRANWCFSKQYKYRRIVDSKVSEFRLFVFSTFSMLEYADVVCFFALLFFNWIYLNNSQRRQMYICTAWSNMALTHSMQKKNIKTFTFNVTLDVGYMAEIAMRIRASNLCYV